MADGLLSQVNTAMHAAVANAAHDLFRNPNGVNDIRWEGMSNPELATAVKLLSDGPGAAGVTQAADALTTIANNLQQIDQTLTTQLQAVGVNWQSQAAELAQEMTTASAAYSGAAGAAGGANATGVTNQGDAFSAARNAVPNVSDLQSPPGGSFLTNATQTLTGHQNDQAQQAAQANQARQQAIDAMHNYTNNSQSGLAGHTPAPPPPGYSVAPKPVNPGIARSRRRPATSHHRRSPCPAAATSRVDPPVAVRVGCQVCPVAFPLFPARRLVFPVLCRGCQGRPGSGFPVGCLVVVGCPVLGVCRSVGCPVSVCPAVPVRLPAARWHPVRSAASARQEGRPGPRWGLPRRPRPARPGPSSRTPPLARRSSAARRVPASRARPPGRTSSCAAGWPARTSTRRQAAPASRPPARWPNWRARRPRRPA